MSIDLREIKNFQDAMVTVMGLGRHKQGSGVGAAKWLMRHGAQIVITDLKSEDELRESIDEIMKWYSQYREEYPDRDIYQPVFVLGEHHEDDFTNVNLVVQNPGVPRESEFVQAAKENGVQVESDVSLFFRYCPFPIYTVTGTRGKSTTTALFGEVLKQINPKTVIAGNILRSPLEDLDMLLESKESVPIVLELSSWLLESLEDIDRGPEIAIFTNAFRDHLDRYQSFESYIAAKELMFKHQTPEQKAILNADNEIVSGAAERVTAEVFWFSMKPFADKQGAYIKDEMLCFFLDGEEEQVCAVEEMAMEGEHNVQNALAASLGARLAGLTAQQIGETLKAFKGLPGRQEDIGGHNGVAYINDTTATSPEGVMAALERFGLRKQIVLITGGTAKGLEYEHMGEKIGETCKYVVFLKGTATDQIKPHVPSEVPRVEVESMQDAVNAAAAVAKEGDVVLLSPGASSFGMFKNEFDRGEQFVEAVNKLA